MNMEQQAGRGPALVAGVVASLLLAGAAHAATYRWVDEKGQVHYSDTLPPQHAGKGHKELDTQGRTVREVQRTALTPEERRQQEAMRQKRAEKEAREREQARYDRALLSSYTRESEIDLVRDRAVELEQLQITSLQARLQNATQKSAQKSAQAGKNAAAQTVAANRAEIAELESQIEQRQRNIEALRVRYEADKARFRELKAQTRR